MKNRLLQFNVSRAIVFCLTPAFAVVLLSTTPAAVQNRRPAAGRLFGHPNLSGIWMGPGLGMTANLTRALGRELPFTPYGAEKAKTVDHADEPGSRCFPPGVTRGMGGPFPFQIVQSDETIAILLEFSNQFRLIYMDVEHPKDVSDYGPEFFGHSVGKWEGDTLVVDTIALDDRTWLDQGGHQHSDQLHLTERFQKTDPDTIKWTVTVEDPVFYTEPWTYSLDFKRQNTRLYPYLCAENNRDREHLVPTKGILGAGPR